ncbi:hypothetical protein C1I99_26525 [Micromonospora deserti]|uniref:Uncharacterized protein n=1 Tax=Micromonospora deserti TaxID=2070366 RepID=A0A2W2BSB2_9ACTN|nr:hypothetical protein C1I99_26525 [Micromonospora deserti]
MYRPCDRTQHEWRSGTRERIRRVDGRRWVLPPRPPRHPPGGVELGCAAHVFDLPEMLALPV